MMKRSLSPLFAAVVGFAACHSPGAAGSGDDDSTTPDAALGGSAAPDAAIINATTPTIPAVTGTCPALATGDVTFSPAGMPPRKVALTLPATKPTTPGQLIFYWHATGSAPIEAEYSLGDTMGQITGAGGTIAAPYPDPTAGEFEWFIVNQSTKQDDFLLADEVVGCLVAAGYVDPMQIHSMGMSAGALQTTALSFIRAEYIASVATYSGGVPPQFTPVDQDPANKFAALIFDGGSADDVFGVDFEAASEAYRSMLVADGHFAAICDHGMGHNIPLDAAPSVAMFFTANPWGAWPSPYANALPASFPSYCSLTGD